MSLKDPVPANDRGFMDYGGGEPVITDYGHHLKVRESSAATRDCVWIFVDNFPDWYQAKIFANLATAPGMPLPSVGIHLTVRNAVELIARLDQFLAGADPEELAEAKKAVYG